MLHLRGDPLRASGSSGGHHPRTCHHPARPPVGHQRRHRPGDPVLSGHHLRRHRRERREGHREIPEGVLPAHFHELPALRRPAQRPAGHRAGVLLYQPELRAPRGGRRAVHPAPRPRPDLRAHHADGTVLWRGLRAGPQAQEGQGPLMTAPHITYLSNYLGGLPL